MVQPELETDCVSSAVALIQRGLSHAQKERFSAATSCFVLAREHLSSAPDPLRLLVQGLDAALQSYTVFWRAQQHLYDASRQFASVDGGFRTQLAALNALLPRFASTFASSGLLREAIPEAAQPLSPLQTPLALHASRRQGAPSVQGASTLPALAITCFGRFTISRHGTPVQLCQNRNGQRLFRYLISQPAHCATTDALMALFWPEDEAAVAHHKLQVAASALRRSLNSGCMTVAGGGYLLWENGTYRINPAVAVQIDTEECLALYDEGRHAVDPAVTVRCYEAACHLYSGPFLVEDLYADWTAVRREQLRRIYLSMCAALGEYYLAAGAYEAAASWAEAVLEEDAADEAGHRLLMRMFATTGRRSEALRQYRRCEAALVEHVGAPPSAETVELLSTILGDAHVLEPALA